MKLIVKWAVRNGAIDFIGWLVLSLFVGEIGLLSLAIKDWRNGLWAQSANAGKAISPFIQL